MEKIRILWLTISRKHRAMSHWWEGLRTEVSSIADVTTIMQPWTKPTRFSKKDIANFKKSELILKSPKLVNSKFDIIYNDAPFCFFDYNWKDIKIPKAALMNDQHASVKSYIDKTFFELGYNILFTTYKNPTKTFHPKVCKTKKVYWLPFAVDTEIFKDYNLNKQIGCLIPGRTHNTIYPIRRGLQRELKEDNTESFITISNKNRLKSLIDSNSYVKFVRLSRPQEIPIVNPLITSEYLWPVNEDYAKILNMSKLAITDTSSYHYTVLKFFEIPACMSVLCSDYIPELGDLGFVPEENMLQIDNPKNIKTSIEKFLTREDLNDIAKRGHDLIYSRHTLKIRAQELVNYLKENI